MAQHESNKTACVDWLTPRYIIEAMPVFDLDPCASVNQQWPTAKEMIRPPADGLRAEWFGRVWCNPPYGHRVIGPWMKRMAEHANGVALVFARTETVWFHEYVWPYASGLLFFRGRLTFIHGEAVSQRQRYGGNAACPSVLVAFGSECRDVLESVKLAGAFIPCPSRAR